MVVLWISLDIHLWLLTANFRVPSLILAVVKTGILDRLEGHVDIVLILLIIRLHSFHSISIQSSIYLISIGWIFMKQFLLVLNKFALIIDLMMRRFLNSGYIKVLLYHGIRLLQVLPWGDWILKQRILLPYDSLVVHIALKHNLRYLILSFLSVLNYMVILKMAFWVLSLIEWLLSALFLGIRVLGKLLIRVLKERMRFRDKFLPQFKLDESVLSFRFILLEDV